LIEAAADSIRRSGICPCLFFFLLLASVFGMPNTEGALASGRKWALPFDGEGGDGLNASEVPGRAVTVGLRRTFRLKFSFESRHRLIRSPTLP